MSAARTLAALVGAGVELRADGKRLALVARQPLPPALAAEVRAAAPRLLALASGAWRADLATWPPWRFDFYEERAAIRTYDGGMPVDLAEQAAYLDALEQPEPPAAPELPPGTDPDSPEAAGFEVDAPLDLPVEPCPGCGAPTTATSGLGFCRVRGCEWVKLPAPMAPPPPVATLDSPPPAPVCVPRPPAQGILAAVEAPSAPNFSPASGSGPASAPAPRAPARQKLPEEKERESEREKENSRSFSPLVPPQSGRGSAADELPAPSSAPPTPSRRRSPPVPAPPALSTDGQAALDRALAAIELALPGARLVAIEEIRRPAPAVEAPGEPIEVQGPQLEQPEQAPSQTLRPSLPPFRWFDVVPRPPERAPAPLAPPVEAAPAAVEPPTRPELYPVEPQPDEPPAVRAARFGYAILPGGQYIEAHRAHQRHLPPAAPWFDTRWTPADSPAHEDERQAIRAAAAAECARVLGPRR